MLSYRHAFHAGNHADVLKHGVLSLIVTALCTKDKPFFCLDTHAGAGRYDLESGFARKNHEYESGITRVLEQKQPHPLMTPYVAAVRALNQGGKVRFYPGSPRLVRSLLRTDDRLVLCEMHPNDAEILRAEFAKDKQVQVMPSDGYQVLKASLPPPERRGLVVIDPAFETRAEWQRLLEGLQEAHRRWPTGTLVLWYPVQDRYSADEFLKKIRRLQIPKTLWVEMSVLQQEATIRMVGSGLIVVNPPWKLETELQDLLPWLWEVLSFKQQGSYRLEWLVGESAQGHI